MKRYQLLLVDDSKLAQEAVKSVLADFHCDVVVADSGEQAIEHCNLMRFDLILMDLGLPGQNGLKITELIRDSSLLNKKTPIVALSAHSEAYFFAQIDKAHLNGFISKPFSRLKATELMNLLEQHAW